MEKEINIFGEFELIIVYLSLARKRYPRLIGNRVVWHVSLPDLGSQKVYKSLDILGRFAEQDCINCSMVVWTKLQAIKAWSGDCLMCNSLIGPPISRGLEGSA